MRLYKFVVLSLFLASSVRAQEEPIFNADPNSAELQTLAKPLELDGSKYGAGPLLEPGRTFYVSPRWQPMPRPSSSIATRAGPAAMLAACSAEPCARALPCTT